jgi:predicted transcriptional regulator
MTPGPSMVRPSFGLNDAVQRMQAQNLTSLPVTRSDGSFGTTGRSRLAAAALEDARREGIDVVRCVPSSPTTSSGTLSTSSVVASGYRDRRAAVVRRTFGR